MGLFNKIFRPNTYGLVDANLETYFKVRAAFPTDRIPTEYGVSMPIQYHAVNTAIQARGLSPSETETALRVFMMGLAEAIDLNGGKKYVTEEQLIRAFLNAVYSADDVLQDQDKKDQFRSAVHSLLPKHARYHSVDLKSQVDLSFFLNP